MLRAPDSPYLRRPWRYQQALAALVSGDIVACPTESVWGLSCDPANARAVDKLLALKRRPMHKGLILVAANYRQIGALVGEHSASTLKQLMAGQSTPVTWLIPHRGAVPDWITGSHDTVAVRISAHPIVKALCEGFGGALVSSSANLAGHAAARTELAVRKCFGASITQYVAGSTGGECAPSRIIDMASGRRLR